MWSFVIIELEIAREAAYSISGRLVIAQIDLLPFDRTPQAFDKHVIERSSTPIPTDLDSRLLQTAGVGGTGELGALIGIDDVRLALTQSVVQCFQTEVRVERVRKRLGQDVATVPVEHGYQVEEAVLQTNVGNIGAPHVVDLGNAATTQQIGITLRTRSRCA